MTDAYNMKSVFSCSDFLSDLWQGGPDAAEPFDPLACPSEGGSTQLGRGRSADLLNLLGQAEQADSQSRIMQRLAASSSNKQESLGTVKSSTHRPCIGRLRAKCTQKSGTSLMMYA